MSIGEFEEVGSTVKEFAADDATVVVGTVIDADMRDEMRVTIVATGLGQGQKRQQPFQVIRTGTGPLNYEQLDTPTVIRNRRSGHSEPPRGEAALEYLDIPAFLRRQAD